MRLLKMAQLSIAVTILLATSRLLFAQDLSQFNGRVRFGPEVELTEHFFSNLVHHYEIARKPWMELLEKIQKKDPELFDEICQDYLLQESVRADPQIRRELGLGPLGDEPSRIITPGESSESKPPARRGGLESPTELKPGEVRRESGLIVNERAGEISIRQAPGRPVDPAMDVDPNGRLRPQRGGLVVSDTAMEASRWDRLPVERKIQLLDPEKISKKRLAMALIRGKTKSVKLRSTAPDYLRAFELSLTESNNVAEFKYAENRIVRNGNQVFAELEPLFRESGIKPFVNDPKLGALSNRHWSVHMHFSVTHLDAETARVRSRQIRMMEWLNQFEDDPANIKLFERNPDVTYGSSSYYAGQRDRGVTRREHLRNGSVRIELREFTDHPKKHVASSLEHLFADPKTADRRYAEQIHSVLDAEAIDEIAARDPWILAEFDQYSDEVRVRVDKEVRARLSNGDKEVMARLKAYTSADTESAQPFIRAIARNSDSISPDKFEMRYLFDILDHRSTSQATRADIYKIIAGQPVDAGLTNSISHLHDLQRSDARYRSVYQAKLAECVSKFDRSACLSNLSNSANHHAVADFIQVAIDSGDSDAIEETIRAIERTQLRGQGREIVTRRLSSNLSRLDPVIQDRVIDIIYRSAISDPQTRANVLSHLRANPEFRRYLRRNPERYREMLKILRSGPNCAARGLRALGER